MDSHDLGVEAVSQPRPKRSQRRNVDCPNGVAFFLPPQQAAILEALVEHYPKGVPHIKLACVAGNARRRLNGEPASHGTVKVQVCHIRQALRDSGWTIVISDGVGYALEYMR